MRFFFLDQFLSNFSQDIGIDLGTANTPVLIRGKGVRLREPSYVAFDKHKKKVIAVGNEAKMMYGRAPSFIDVIRPIRDGVIADFEIAQSMLKYILGKVGNHGLLRPRVIVGIPGDVTDVEYRAVSEAARQAGARSVYLISQPLAAAIGGGLPVLDASGSMVVDIGGGTMEAAVISLGGTVVWRARRVAGDEMDATILNYVKKTYNLLIGEKTAEDLKIELGSALESEENRYTYVKGRDLQTGLPRIQRIYAEEIYNALREIVAVITELVKSTLEATPPELVSDIIEKGIMLTGGSSLLKGLDQYLSKATGVNCYRATDPLSTVVLGTERLFKEPLLMKVIFGKSQKG